MEKKENLIILRLADIKYLFIASSIILFYCFKKVSLSLFSTGFVLLKIKLKAYNSRSGGVFRF
jgi:hypothetical protein